jgi:DNA replication protein DnaC
MIETSNTATIEEQNAIEDQRPAERTEKCPEHGEFTARPLRWWHDLIRRVEWRWTKCPKCEEERRQREEAESARRRQEDWDHHVGWCIRNAEIPLRFKGKTLESFQVETKEQRVGHDTCQRYATGFKANHAAGSSLVICGAVGTGKTHLACGILHAVASMGGSVSYRE